MEHNMWYDQEKEIIHLEFKNDFNTADVAPIRDKLYELSKDKTYRQMVIQINKTAKVESRETREKANQILREADISHVAFIGGSAANRMIAKVLLKTGAIKTKGDFFKTVDEGINWILSKR